MAQVIVLSSRIAGLVCFVLSVLLSTFAYASETSDAKAEHLFISGTEAFEQAQFDRAYKLHREAWDLRHSFRTAVGLGQVELHLGRYRDAAEHLTFAVNHYPPDASARLKSNIEEGLAVARAHVGILEVNVNVRCARVSLDGRPLPEFQVGRVVFVDPGRHTLEAKCPGYETARVTVQAIVDSQREVSLVLSPVKPTRPSATDRRDVRPVIFASIVGGTLTAGALASAIVFSSRSSSLEDDIRTLRGELTAGPGSDVNRCAGPVTDPDCALLRKFSDDRDRADDWAIASVIGASVFAVATVGTVVALWPNDARGKARDESVRVSPRLGAEGGGLLLSGRF